MSREKKRIPESLAEYLFTHIVKHGVIILKEVAHVARKKKNPCFRSHILCPRFEHNYFTKLDYVQKTGIGVKQFVLILSYRPLHTFSRTLSCSMDANLVVDRRWAKYQIKLFTISQLLNLNPCCTYKKLPACKTSKILTAFLILRKKTIIVFNHVTVKPGQAFPSLTN